MPGSTPRPLFLDPTLRSDTCGTFGAFDLGDRRLDFLVNFYGSFDNSDLAATYTYLKRRIDLSVGAFLFNNYYNSVITSVSCSSAPSLNPVRENISAALLYLKKRHSSKPTPTLASAFA